MYRLQLLLKKLVISLGLYGVAGLVGLYFVWEGVNGQRGLKAGEEYEQRLTQLRHERDLAHMERVQWERRIALMHGDEVDADVLDEEAHALLGRVAKNEVVILAPPAKPVEASR